MVLPTIVSAPPAAVLWFVDAPLQTPALTAEQWWGMLAVKVLVLIAGGVAIGYFLTKLVSSMAQAPPGVSSSWSGMGGGLGGWKITQSAAWMVFSLLSLVLFTAVALQFSDGLIAPPKPDAPASKESSGDSGKSEKSSDATKASDTTKSSEPTKASDATAAKPAVDATKKGAGSTKKGE